MTAARSADSAQRTRRSTAKGRQAAPKLVDLALAAARRGMHVFPLVTYSKFPRLHGKRECDGRGECSEGHLGWEQRATTDPELIRRWWRRNPRSNIGIACGPSGIYVVDLDAGHDGVAPEEWSGAKHGRDVLAQLAERAGEPYPGETFTVRSPTPSYHLYFRVGPDSTLRNTAGRAGWRIDSRGHGGFIVAPGSVRRDGAYTVEVPPPIAPLPEWLLPLFEKPPLPVSGPVDLGAPRPLSDGRRQAYLDTVSEKIARAPEGTAHDTLVSAACTLGRLVAGDEFSEADVRAVLQAAARQRKIPSDETEDAISYGIEKGAEAPRRLEDRKR